METPHEPVMETGSYAAPPAAPPPRRSRGGQTLFWVFLGICLFLFVGVTAIGAAVALFRGGDPSASVSSWMPGAKVGIVPIEGEIFDATGAIEDLRRYEENHNVRAIVVRINSPGGAIVPSQEIFAEIRRIRSESGKPVVASMDSVAASGGYYIAAACDRIVANPGSITGSIGVILQWMNMQELVRWAKLRPETLTSGPMKDAGSAFRDLTPQERAYLQRIVTQLHNQFVRAVADGRKGKLTLAEVARIADGRVFTGEEAKQLRLVDQLGNLNDAVTLAGELAGLEGTPDTIVPRREDRGLLDVLVGSARIDKVVGAVIKDKPEFLFRW